MQISIMKLHFLINSDLFSPLMETGLDHENYGGCHHDCLPLFWKNAAQYEMCDQSYSFPVSVWLMKCFAI